MEPTQNPIKMQILEVYLQLNDVTATMENQLRGGVGGDYRLTYHEFRKLMYKLYDLSHWHLETPDKNYLKWRDMSHLTEPWFIMKSIKMYERYVNKLVYLCIIDVKKDLV